MENKAFIFFGRYRKTSKVSSAAILLGSLGFNIQGTISYEDADVPSDIYSGPQGLEG